MAQLPTTQTTFFNLPISVQRLNPRPLDNTSLWTNYQDALEYAKTGATAHVGQLLSVVETIEGISTTHVYVISNTDGSMKKLDSFELSADGSLLIDSNMTVTGTAKFQKGIHISNGEHDISLITNTDGILDISGAVSIAGQLTSLNGFNLGIGGASQVVSISKEDGSKYIHILSDTDYEYGTALKFGGKSIIEYKTKGVVSISAPGLNMNLGGYDTNKIVLKTGIFNPDANTQYLSINGDGYFPNSLKAEYHNQGLLLSTYGNESDSEDTGVMIGKRIKFNAITGPSMYSNGTDLLLNGPFLYNDMTSGTAIQNRVSKVTTIGYKVSDSLYNSPNGISSALVFNTDADFYVFDKPIEGKNSIGIAESKTKLSSGKLFFNDDIYLVAIADGIQHHGQSYFDGNVGSKVFNSGMAGSGWRIASSGTTGNIIGTFDELVIRKKMRVYELEVQKNSVTNGALWISDSCAGDTVTLLN